MFIYFMWVIFHRFLSVTFSFSLSLSIFHVLKLQILWISMSKLFDYKFVSPILTFSIQPVQLCMHVWNVFSQLWKMWHNLKEHIENIDLPNEAAALKNIIVYNFIINNDKSLLHKCVGAS